MKYLLTPEECLYLARLVRDDMETCQRMLDLELEVGSGRAADLCNVLKGRLDTINKLALTAKGQT